MKLCDYWPFFYLIHMAIKCNYDIPKSNLVMLRTKLPYRLQQSIHQRDALF